MFVQAITIYPTYSLLAFTDSVEDETCPTDEEEWNTDIRRWENSAMINIHHHIEGPTTLKIYHQCNKEFEGLLWKGIIPSPSKKFIISDVLNYENPIFNVLLDKPYIDIEIYTNDLIYDEPNEVIVNILNDLPEQGLESLKREIIMDFQGYFADQN